MTHPATDAPLTWNVAGLLGDDPGTSRDFDVAEHQPHPPGYPLLIGLGKAITWITGDPFTSLVALGVISSCVGFVALAVAFGSFAGGGEEGERAGILGALLFCFSPAMLVYGPLALSDAPA